MKRPDKINNCHYCKSEKYSPLNREGMRYSGIEMRILGRVGILCVRYFEGADFENTYATQDAVNINFCPMCGRKFDE